MLRRCIVRRGVGADGRRDHPWWHDHQLENTKQVQAPRSTAESEVTAMAYAGQTLEGVMGLYESMGIQLKRPTLFCDNRAACCLTTGSNGWRTKTLVNTVLGLRSLVKLNLLAIVFKPTAK